MARPSSAGVVEQRLLYIDNETPELQERSEARPVGAVGASNVPVGGRPLGGPSVSARLPVGFSIGGRPVEEHDSTHTMMAQSHREFLIQVQSESPLYRHEVIHHQEDQKQKVGSEDPLKGQGTKS